MPSLKSRELSFARPRPIGPRGLRRPQTAQSVKLLAQARMCRAEHTRLSRWTLTTTTVICGTSASPGPSARSITARVHRRVNGVRESDALFVQGGAREIGNVLLRVPVL